jgi:23S rRNA (cytidine1920-2'-O)/16S rRNA (cytidine1409-2'-O)-methyltransferase
MRRLALIDLLKSRFPSREEKELFGEILRGGVQVGGRPVTKPGTPVPIDSPLSIREKPPYVSRGGEKLAAALDAWSIDCAGTAWVDAGCSTGGFTDCLLQRGASLVYAVDVGRNQLDPRIRGDVRVRAREGTNIMALVPGDLDPPPAWAAADLSFRSLRRAAAHILLLAGLRMGVFLVKPQFEYRDPPPDFKGVVREPRALHDILSDLLVDLAAEGVTAHKAVASPIHGRKGNREFLFLLRMRAEAPPAAAGLLERLLSEGSA